MVLFDFLKTLYSLDTLDSRLTTSSQTPLRNTDASSIADAKLLSQSTSQNAAPDRIPNTQPSKWRTKEFYFYYLCFLTIPIFMVKSVYDVSKGIYTIPISCFMEVSRLSFLQNHIQTIQSFLIYYLTAGYLAAKSSVLPFHVS